MRLWVVVPAFDEAAGITATLDALAAQTDRDFRVLVVDNASTDGTADVVRAHPLGARVVVEPQRGTGAAADTGMRHAIAAGATHLARTDADCVPAPDWTARIRAAFADLDLVAGRLLPRTDEGVPAWQRGVLVAAVSVAAAFGRLRPGNRVPGALGPYVMSAGCNMAITAALYERAGGFPRTRIQDVHEDRALVNAVRPLTARYGARRDVVVRGSSRRVRAWGLVRTLGWYADHRYRPEHVDIR
ncbi:glycosyltransferase [Pseudonocardia hydrocarbonoxydans]|uniref:4,4'-diaponeurosporenoate glycosyltransferase n=1 Tax=Pseudonocardia hydrocarbonoxydans TaxID=76726 RepID=A0A4Y3WS82_9PSEU|nr:glycosyltransferase [Pseudonocardia hydrocarbonoxydans]GEC20216.1 glycosyl transferase [Pseudonocardia hydrocarbonoxydans]